MANEHYLRYSNGFSATGFIHNMLKYSINIFNLQCPMSEVQKGVLQTQIVVNIIITLEQ